MNHASLELGEELFYLSGWDPGHELVIITNSRNASDCGVRKPIHFNKIGYGTMGCITYSPAYDLGYLLRKLPVLILGNQSLQIIPFDDGSWVLEYNNLDGSPCGIGSEAMAPEDAACKLAIKLFKQGIITKETL